MKNGRRGRIEDRKDRKRQKKTEAARLQLLSLSVFFVTSRENYLF